MADELFYRLGHFEPATPLAPRGGTLGGGGGPRQGSRPTVARPRVAAGDQVAATGPRRMLWP